VADGYWHHVAATHNGTKLSLYVDGVLDNYAAVGDLIAPNTAQVWINGNSESDGFFDGRIDDVRIYNYALGLEDIQALAAMGALIPQVDAGENQLFFLSSSSLQLDATVTDDGRPVAAALTWTKQSGPGDVTFLPGADIEDPSVTFSEIGTYVLRLTADDTLAEVYDEVVIEVGSPLTCQNVIDDGLLIVGDFSGPEGTPDCYIDIFDFAAFAGNWIRCNDPQDPQCEFPF